MWIEEGKLKRLAEHPIARYFIEGQRVQLTSERVDSLPLLIAQLKEVRVPELLNESFPTHGDWQGLSLER